MKVLILMILVSAGLVAGDLNGKWSFVWQTPGGERRSVLTFTAQDDKVEAQFPEGKPVQGTFKDNKLTLDGRLYSSEAGHDGVLRLSGTLTGERLQGTASWDEHQMTFTAQRTE
jgi:hypothetical protein